MVADQVTRPGSSAGKRAKHLRMVAVVVLLLGIAGACATFWGLPVSGGLPEDVSAPDNSKVLQRNIEMNSGKMGLFASDLSASLQDPGTRAAVIVVAASLVAGVCLYFAWLLDQDAGEESGETKPG